MLIQILGTGCTKCKELHNRVLLVASRMGLLNTDDLRENVQIEKVTDIQKILAFEILSTPGLVVNGKVRVAGRLPSAAEIETLITSAFNEEPTEE